jgi:hypothetical protein
MRILARIECDDISNGMICNACTLLILTSFPEGLRTTEKKYVLGFFLFFQPKPIEFNRAEIEEEFSRI